MATKKPAAAPDQPEADLAPDGCIWMYRDSDRAAVHVDSGSVDVMAEQGWTKEPTE